MANLTRSWRWETFHPDIGENLSLPEADRLTLRIASGLPADRLDRMRAEYVEALGHSTTDAEVQANVLRVFEGLVDVVGENTIDGQPVTTLEQYLSTVLKASGIYSLTELVTAVAEFNSIQGTQRLFSQRHSGGLLSTRARTAVKDTAKTGGP